MIGFWGAAEQVAKVSFGQFCLCSLLVPLCFLLSFQREDRHIVGNEKKKTNTNKQSSWQLCFRLCAQAPTLNLCVLR